MEKVENKITAEQLEKLSAFVNAMNNGVMQLGAQHATMKPLNKKIKLWQK